MTHSLETIFLLFVAQLGFGSAVLMPFMPIKEIGKSYQQFYYGFIVFFLGLFLYMLHQADQFSYAFLGIVLFAVWIFALSFFSKTFTQLEKYLNIVFALISLIFLVVFPQKYFFHGDSWSYAAIPLISFLFGTLFLSLTIMSMIFGHWYLINTKLPIKHLVSITRSLVVVTYLRVFSVLVVTYIAYYTVDSSLFARLIDISGHGIFFWARVLAGLLVPILVAHLAYESAKIKSNQSATGILYAGCVFVIMGELMALYLFTISKIIF